MQSQDVMKDAVDTAKPSESPQSTDTKSTVDAENAKTSEDTTKWATVYFTEGELLPWKGRWWRVRLLEIDGEKIVGLVAVKPTSGSIKRSNSAERRSARHNAKPGVKRMQKWVDKLTASVGAQYSSRAFSQELQSTGALPPEHVGRS